MREFKNMKIRKVANASEHAMGRTGRILAHVKMDQNGQVVMEYLQTDNNRYCFRLDVKAVKERWFSKTVVLTTTSGSTYELVPATDNDIKEARRAADWNRTMQMLRAKYGDDVAYMAPEQQAALVAQMYR